MTQQFRGFRISPQQQRLWRAQRHGGALRLRALIRITGPLEPAQLQQAFARVGALHEVLRTSFRQAPGMPFPLQATVDEFCPSWFQHDLREHENPREALDELTEETAHKVFDYESGSLLDLHLIQMTDDQWSLLVVAPALCLDPGGLACLMAEVGRALQEPGDAFFDTETMQYIDISEWLHDTLEDEDSQEGLEFWQEYDLAVMDNLTLSLEQQRRRSASFQGRSMEVNLENETLARLEEMAGDQGLSPVLSAAWLNFLKRHCESDQLVLGVTADGRNFEGLEDAIGLLDRVIPVKAELSDLLTSLKLIAETASDIESVCDMQEFFQWKREAHVTQHAEPWFFPFTFDFQQGFETIEADDLSFGLEMLDYSGEAARLSLRAVVYENRTHLSLLFDPNYLSDEDAEVLAEQFATLLADMAIRPDVTIDQLNMLSDREYQKQVHQWSNVAPVEGRDILIHQMFTRHAEAAPEALAIEVAPAWDGEQNHTGMLGDRSSYGQLERISNQWARYFRSRGIGPETRVGVIVGRSPERIALLLGLLKSGGVMVPLDPTYPLERIMYMAKDAGISCLITRQDIQVPDLDVPNHCFEELWGQVQTLSDQPLEEVLDPDHLAYIIYTSGSTGKPKGVQVPHRAIANMGIHFAEVMALEAGSRVLQFALLNFDGAIWDLVLPWTRGAAMCIATREQMMPGEPLQRIIAEMGVTHANLPPASLAVTRPEGCECLQHINVSGEICKFDTYKRWSQGRHFYNGYGPAEITVCVTTWKCEDEIDNLPIGRPMSHTTVYVADSQSQILPAGLPGELLIGGMGVSRGYAGKPGQTAERFIPDPYGRIPGARLYRSGDRVRYLGNGVLMFLDRIDRQIKLRGFRIELGEIEEMLTRFDGVADAAVVVIERMRSNASEQRLTGFVAPVKGREEAVSTDALMNWLRESMPAYMIPQSLIILEELPVNLSGKVDRKLLASPEMESRVERNYVAPRNDGEKMIAEIWESVLDEDRIGINDNFFEIGGHSLLAAQVITRIREAFQVELSIRDIFNNPTLPALHDRIEQSKQEANLIIDDSAQSEDEEEIML